MIPCPCCRAANPAGPACRRCKADLSLLFAVAARRDALVADARRLASAGKFPAAVRSLDAALALRADDAVRRLRAAALLLTGDYPAARAAYDTLATRPAGPGG